METRKTTRKTFTGTVISTKRAKTITVAVETYIKHPLYGKRFRKITKLHAHDENGDAHEGDFVSISETRPVSKTKTFRLVKIIKTSREGQ